MICLNFFETSSSILYFKILSLILYFSHIFFCLSNIIDNIKLYMFKLLTKVNLCPFQQTIYIYIYKFETRHFRTILIKFITEKLFLLIFN